MNKTLKFFSFVLLTSTIMPLSAFALRGSTDCNGDVEKTAFGTWGGMTMKSGFESFYSDAEQKVYKDKQSLQKFQKRYLDALKNESLVSNWEYTKPLSGCNSVYGCEIPCDGNTTCPYPKNDPDRNEKCKETNCKNGQKLKDCNYAVYKCMLNIHIGEEYQEYMIQKICSNGTGSLSQSDKSAIEQERNFQQSGMTSKKTTTSASKAGGANQKKVATPPKATTDARARANAEYAAQMREPWQEYEAEENVLPPEANTNSSAKAPYADVNSTVANPDYQAPHEHIDKLSAPTPTALAAPDIKSQNIKINEPTQLSDKDQKKMLEQQKKDTCENFVNGKYSVGVCWCGTTKVTDMTKTCQQINEEKQAQKDADKAERDAKKQEKENKKAEEKAKKAEAEAKDKEKCENTIGGKYSVGACWCGTTKVTDQSKTCEQIKKEKADKKDQAKIDKEAKNITSKANSLSIGDSLTYETALENELAVGEALSKWESKCEEKTLALAGGAEYDITTTTSGNKTTLTCLIKNCTEDEYNVTTDKKSCTKNANGCADGDEKCNKKVAKAENKLEKELEKDINTLTKEFLSVVKSITQTCENGGGSISENGECIVPETTETNGARANKRTAGAKSRKR